MTDLLRGLVSGFAEGSIPRYLEIIHPAPEETRTAEEVIARIRGKLAAR